MRVLKNNFSSKQILRKLKSLANPENIKGMARFGINSKNTLGVLIPDLRNIAKEIKIFFDKDLNSKHVLAQQLWVSKIHEAKILASMIDNFELLTEKQMDNWVKDFDSWDVCDQVCLNLFVFSKYSFKKTIEWAEQGEEFVKRAGFALMASLAFKGKNIKDQEFEKFFSSIKKQANDERNFVKKAINWALRQIGKRNLNLNKKAIKIAMEIQKMNSKSAKWIASNAIKELTNEAIKKRLNSKFLCATKIINRR